MSYYLLCVLMCAFPKRRFEELFQSSQESGPAPMSASSSTISLEFE